MVKDLKTKFTLAVCLFKMVSGVKILSFLVQAIVYHNVLIIGTVILVLAEELTEDHQIRTLLEFRNNASLKLIF